MRMTNLGIRVLLDELEMIDVEGKNVCILGIDNWMGVDRLQNWHHYEERINRIKTRFRTVPSNCLTLALAHTPDIIQKLDGLKINVMFSGHTHGGQIRLPFLGPLFSWSSFQRKYNRGLYKYNGAYLYVNAGVGTDSFLSVRLFCPPEISLIKICGSRSGKKHKFSA